MANGFQAIRVQGTSGTCGIIETYFYNSSSNPVAIGDVVGHSTLLATDNSGFSGVQVETGATVVASTGVVVGFEVNPQEGLLKTGLEASTDSIVRVAIDPRQVYKVEVAAGVFDATDFGFAVDTIATVATISGNLITSNMTINTTASSTSTTRPWLIVGADVGTLQSDNTFTTFYVRPNANSFYLGSGAG